MTGGILSKDRDSAMSNCLVCNFLKGGGGGGGGICPKCPILDPPLVNVHIFMC